MKNLKKIVYIILDHEPPGIVKINENDSYDIKNGKYILNAMKRDYYQRNFIINGLKDSSDNDFILISDLDEIPKLDTLNLNLFNKKLVFLNKKCSITNLIYVQSL